MNTIIKYSILGIALIILFVMPEVLIFNNNVEICIFKNLTGVECPLCGMLRASYLLVRINISDALSYNPLVIMLPLLVIIEILFDLFHLLWLRKVGMIMAYIFITGLVVLFIIRFYNSIHI